MPLQLLNLGVIIPRILSLILWTRTPRGMSIIPADRTNSDLAIIRLRRIKRPANDQLWRSVPLIRTFIFWSNIQSIVVLGITPSTQVAAKKYAVRLKHKVDTNTL